MDSYNLEWGLLVGSYECSNEPLCPIKCKEFLDRVLASQEGLCCMELITVCFYIIRSCLGYV